MKITISKKVYQVKFGFGALRILCKKWGVKSIGGLDPFFKKLDFKDEPSFEQWDLIGDLALSGVEYANPDTVFTSEQILDVLFKNPNLLTELINSFAESMPNQQPVDPAKRGK